MQEKEGGVQMEIRRLMDKFFDTRNFTDEQLLQIWEKSALKINSLNNPSFSSTKERRVPA